MLHLLNFNRVDKFIKLLNESDQLKIAKAVAAVRSEDFGSVHIKTLQGPLKELIIHEYRILFCIENNTLYLLSSFIKKSAKTPKQEIKTAEKIYKLIIQK